jgi:hypothetical protein
MPASAGTVAAFIYVRLIAWNRKIAAMDNDLFTVISAAIVAVSVYWGVTSRKS